MRAQLLDGSATNVLDTVRQLGFLQIDPISTVAPPQHLVLWSRLGPYDVAELDRLLWDERKLFEWDAFVWPIEELPLVRRACGAGGAAALRARALGRRVPRRRTRVQRYVLRELERRGPLLSRELEDEPLRDRTSRTAGGAAARSA